MQWQIFAEVPPATVSELMRLARRRTFKKGEVVFHREDPAESMHLIARGRFAVRIMTPLGETATIAVRGPSESFGEMALLSEDGRRAATVAALEAGETFSIYQREFHLLRRERPEVNEFLLRFLAKEIRAQNARLLEALYLPVDRRVRRRLVELAELYRSTAGEIPLTQEVLAEMAGATRQTVNQVLQEEQERGTIEIRRGRTIIRDLDGLAKRI